jgi:hypothetical protein
MDRGKSPSSLLKVGRSRNPGATFARFVGGSLASLEHARSMLRLDQAKDSRVVPSPGASRALLFAVRARIGVSFSKKHAKRGT